MLRGFSFDSLLGRGGPLTAHRSSEACDCGCLPSMLSLHEQAKERMRQRDARAATQKPTVAELLAQRKALDLAAARTGIDLAMLCEDK